MTEESSGDEKRAEGGDETSKERPRASRADSESDCADDAAAPLVGAISALVATPELAAVRVDSRAEEAHWREEFYTRPYVVPGHRWTQFAPAFRQGWLARGLNPGRSWRDVEPRLERLWRAREEPGELRWSLARLAARDAWDRAGSWFDDRREELHWRRAFPTRSYATGEDYGTFRVAFRFGWEGKRRHPELSWKEAADRMQAEWNEAGLDRRLSWRRARPAVRDAWHRVERMRSARAPEAD